ncbi:hypothetical protein CIL05_00415 [Virgibacillus profundi]|uniref:DUF624 domain-containing protein n=1 Tax=Virgibacillus profundi TaxID=2024555 RepID=A0A2A2IIF0_9BACI|nr:YesL family protein [Virgibacillus profundi]PAV31158.1 hypothetical protein CIL05_00415 [Virgibacillus profundi]PXY55341.1 DUF624 domain-containing protein [Virgibacillus profundi]
MQGIANGFYRIMEWVTRFAYVNLLWVAFTLLGLVLFGFMPATTAMFGVVRKWVRGEEDAPIFPTFWKVYRDEFLRSNVIGIILFGVGYLLTIEFQILRTQVSTAYYIASFGVIAQAILYAIIVAYFFPIFVHFKLKFTQYFKWPFVVGIMHPILTIFLLIAVAALNLVTFKVMPGLLFFFGGSVTAFILMWGASLTFAKFEKAEA